MPERMKCPHCGSDMRITDLFCSTCGTKIKGSVPEQKPVAAPAEPVVCISCGVLNPASNAACFSCGSALEVPAQHTAKPLESKHAAATTPKRSGFRYSLSSQIVAAFAVFIAVIIIIEWQNRPSGGSQQPVQQQQSDTPLSQPPTGETLGQIAMFEATVKSDPKNAEAHLQLANLLHDAHFFPRAIETYKQYLKLMPKATDARVDMAICYFETGDAARAVKEIETAIAIDPKHQMAMFNLGVIHLSTGNVAESKKWLQRCIDSDPQSVAGQRARDILKQH